jgi:phage terminase large subunit
MKDSIDLFGELRMGCDVAGEGSNFSVITLRGKNGAKILFKEHTPDTMAFVSKIVEMYRKYQPSKIYLDKVGIGKPVFDRLVEIPEMYVGNECVVVGVMAGESADDTENFFNKRAEMFWRQRDWLMTSNLEGNDWLDLLDVRYKVQSDKKIKIKSKDEMIKEGIFSPDVADSLSLTFYDAEKTFINNGIQSFVRDYSV